MTATLRQLALPLDDLPAYEAADFYPTGGSRDALKWLEKPSLWDPGRLILWGEPGCGKTHLLHIWAHSHGAHVMNGSELRQTSFSISGPIVVDDIDMVEDETSFFHLINAAQQAGQPVLLAARQPPSRQTIALPDLASRLRASMTVEMSASDDADRAALLARFAANRQLVLNAQVQNFLLSHLPRTPAALIEAVTRLDRAALANGGKISRNLAAAVLNDLASLTTSGSEMLLNGHSQDNYGLL